MIMIIFKEDKFEAAYYLFDILPLPIELIYYKCFLYFPSTLN
jgi:hypothetical protein